MARICPACQRLYRLGDILPEHLAEEHGRDAESGHASPFLLKEQEISGLCEWPCVFSRIPHLSIPHNPYPSPWDTPML